MNELSDEQIEEFKEAFSLFDQDGKGYIFTKELGTVLRSLGIHTSDEEKNEFINKYDENAEGIIYFKNFLEIIISKIAETKIEEELSEAFKLFDHDKRTFININNFKDDLSLYFPGIGKQEIDEICEFFKFDEVPDYIKIEEAVMKITQCLQTNLN